MKRGIIFLSTIISLCLIVGSAQAQNSALALRKGLTVVFAVYGAKTQSGEYAGDYETTERVAELYADGGYKMEFRFARIWSIPMRPWDFKLSLPKIDKIAR